MVDENLLRQAVAAVLREMAHERPGASRPDTLLRLPEVMARTGLKRSTIYNKMRAGTFPQQIPVSKTMVVWRESEICAWIDHPR